MTHRRFPTAFLTSSWRLIASRRMAAALRCDSSGRREIEGPSLPASCPNHRSTGIECVELDLVAVPADRTQPIVRRRIGEGDRYFDDLSARWSMLLNEVRATIPPPTFMRG